MRGGAIDLPDVEEWWSSGNAAEYVPEDRPLFLTYRYVVLPLIPLEHIHAFVHHSVITH